MGQVIERQGAIHPEGDPLHGRDGAIFKAKVGLDHQRLVGGGNTAGQQQGERNGAGSGTNIHI